LVPLALLISAFAPWLITPLLMIGGLYLCFEGFEKVLHSLIHKKEHSDQLNLPEGTDLVAYEKDKIKGAIRTDFILSAEIVVIALGTVQNADFISQVLVVSLIAIAMTVGVYALVAGIVKIDDLGLHLSKKHQDGLLNTLGMGLVTFAPKLMKTLSIVGTIAMFLVGGGIIAHALPHIEAPLDSLPPALEAIVSGLVPMLVNFGIGLLAGALVYLAWEYVVGPLVSRSR
jgi:predicted DNA repair protein MutK